MADADLPQTNVALNCPHCGVYVALKHGITRSGITPLMWNKSGDESWWLGVCPNCQQGVLVQEYVFHLINREQSRHYTFFPAARPTPTDTHIPDEIRRDIDEAKLCFSVAAYRACAVMARRALQNACIEQGATAGGNLVSQLHELAKNGVVTKSLKEWGDAVRWVGNDAAHPNHDDVTKEDAEDILKLAEQFMHVVYVAPAIAKDIQAKRHP